MSTNAHILLEETDGTIQQIYSHWDGYLTGVGYELFTHFHDELKVRRLIALGDASCIGEFLAPSKMTQRFGFGPDWKKLMDCPDEVVNELKVEDRRHCKFYHRDRNEPWKDVHPHMYSSLAEYKESDIVGWIEYVYLYSIESQSWFYYAQNPESYDFAPLTAEVVDATPATN